MNNPDTKGPENTKNFIDIKMHTGAPGGAKDRQWSGRSQDVERIEENADLSDEDIAPEEEEDLEEDEGEVPNPRFHPQDPNRPTPMP